MALQFDRQTGIGPARCCAPSLNIPRWIICW